MAIPSGENNQCQKETEGRKNMKYSENWKKKKYRMTREARKREGRQEKGREWE